VTALNSATATFLAAGYYLNVTTSNVQLYTLGTPVASTAYSVTVIQ
jgi:hypothetical protein